MCGTCGDRTGSGITFTSLLMKKSASSKVISYWILLELSIWCRATSISFSTLWKCKCRKQWILLIHNVKNLGSNFNVFTLWELYWSNNYKSCVWILYSAKSLGSIPLLWQQEILWKWQEIYIKADLSHRRNQMEKYESMTLYSIHFIGVEHTRSICNHPLPFTFIFCSVPKS